MSFWIVGNWLVVSAEQRFVLLDYDIQPGWNWVNGAFMPGTALAIDSDWSSGVFLLESEREGCIIKQKRYKRSKKWGDMSIAKEAEKAKTKTEKKSVKEKIGGFLSDLFRWEERYGLE